MEIRFRSSGTNSDYFELFQYFPNSLYSVMNCMKLFPVQFMGYALPFRYFWVIRYIFGTCYFPNIPCFWIISVISFISVIIFVSFSVFAIFRVFVTISVFGISGLFVTFSVLVTFQIFGIFRLFRLFMETYVL